MTTTVNYKTKKPVYYNKGTKWESSHDEFLAYYTFKSIEDAKVEVEEINRTHPSYLFNGQVIDWDEIDYFFVDEQEIFDTRD